MTTNGALENWIDEMAALCLPDEIVWVNGSEAQRDALRAEACRKGEIIELNQEVHPGCYYHRTDPGDVARSEDKTFICSRSEKDSEPRRLGRCQHGQRAHRRPVRRAGRGAA
jgi:phosphoenolpyruvate carboxykinase (GTP)